MSKLRLEVKNKIEADEIKKLLKEVFTIEEESVLYETEKNYGYYIDFKITKKEFLKPGRKEKFTEEQKTMINMYRQQGKSITELAKIFKCSRGLIHKILNS